jgi:hypothetical protein
MQPFAAVSSFSRFGSSKLVSGRHRMTTASVLLKFPPLRLHDWKHLDEMVAAGEPTQSRPAVPVTTAHHRADWQSRCTP